MVSPDQHQSCYIMLALKKFKIFTISNSAYFVFFCERMKLHSREFPVQTTHTHSNLESHFGEGHTVYCVNTKRSFNSIYGY